MRLAVFGLSVSSSWGNGHATLWRGLIAALARRGWSTTFFERDQTYYAQYRDTIAIRGGELVIYQGWDDIKARAMRECSAADVAMVTSYCPDSIPACQLVTESGAGTKCFYDLDTPVTLDALSRGSRPAYIPDNGLAHFDIVLSYAGGKALKELQVQLGARTTAPLYGSVDPEAHHRVPRDERFASDCSYLGTFSEDRQNTLDQLFLKPAAKLAERKFLIGGAMYNQGFPWLPNIYFVGHVPPGDHPAFYSSSRLTVNVTRRAMAENGYCPSGRLFEAAACGVPVLSDDWEGLHAFFTPGEEILVGHSTEEAVQAISRPDSDLSAIARRARERVLAQHTADERAREFETIIASFASKASAPMAIGA